MKTNKFVANLKKVIESCQDEPCVGELLQILVLCDVFVFIRSNDTNHKVTDKAIEVNAARSKYCSKISFIGHTAVCFGIISCVSLKVSCDELFFRSIRSVLGTVARN